ncbi:Hsp70 protein, putative [Angomonas deanei]|uniref:peptidylprolyl isomerase n=1 Tax=Angomonas deanei TaxID=59799 RepID=A0A7G2CF19_9TRYP|nr:Hsp70 protein, putative [Angomonas deanei]
MTSVGLDLGAGTTRLALLDRIKPMPTVVLNELSNESTATSVYYNYSQGEKRGYGETASSKQVTKVKETITDLATWLYQCDHQENIRQESRVLGEEMFSAAQVTAYFIKCMLRLSEAAAVHPVCIAVPTVTGRESVVTLKQAALVAGVEEGRLTICRSEEAAAVYLHHLQYNTLPEGPAEGSEEEEAFSWVVVLDIGQSCSTGVVLKLNKKKIIKVSTHALNMGSHYIDVSLCGYVYEELEKQLRAAGHAEAAESMKGDVKLLRKVLRECKKVKEILSTTDETKAVFEGIAGGEIDLTLNISKAKCEALIQPFITALEEMFLKLAGALPERGDGVQENTIDSLVRIEAIGGGWRTPAVSQLIQSVFRVGRVGVSLDANLAVAEGAAILVEVLQPTSEGRHPVHEVELVQFVAADPDSDVRRPLSEADMREVASLRQVEEELTSRDEKIQERLNAVNELDSFVLQHLQHLDEAFTKHIKGDADREKRFEETKSFLLSLDEYLREDCEGNETAAIQEKKTQAEAHVRATLPELEQYFESIQQAMKAQEAQLQKLSEEAAKENEENGDNNNNMLDSLKSDPQRLKMAQKRREQGATLFKEDCFAEAQKRFVQALAILGEVYDTQNEENKKTKHDISLSCHLNIASCSYKLGIYKNCISNATAALDLSPQHPKALFRRGQARVMLKEYKEALQDLQTASQLLNGADAAVEAELQKCKTLLEKEKEREKKMFSKMFQ